MACISTLNKSKKLIVILLTLGTSSCILDDCFWMAASQMASSWISAFWMAASDLQSLQNSPRRNWMLRQPLLFTYWLPKHLVFWFTHNNVSQATYGYLTLIVQQLCDLWDVMPCHWSPGTSHTTITQGSGGFPKRLEAF